MAITPHRGSPTKICIYFPSAATANYIHMLLLSNQSHHPTVFFHKCNTVCTSIRAYCYKPHHFLHPCTLTHCHVHPFFAWYFLTCCWLGFKAAVRWRPVFCELNMTLHSPHLTSTSLCHLPAGIDFPHLRESEQIRQRPEAPSNYTRDAGRRDRIMEGGLHATSIC